MITTHVSVQILVWRRAIITQVAFVPENKADYMESLLNTGIFLLCLWNAHGEQDKAERVNIYTVSTDQSNSIFFTTNYIEKVAILGVGASVLAALAAPLFGFSLTNFFIDGSFSNSKYANYGIERFTHDQDKQSEGFTEEDLRKSPNLLRKVNASLQAGRDKFEEAVKQAEKNEKSEH